MPGMNEDWMFGITSGRTPPTQTATVQGSAFPKGATSTLHSDPAAAQQWSKADTTFAESPTHAEVDEVRQAPEACQEEVSIVASALAGQAADVPASVKEAVDRFESWTLAQSLPMAPPLMSDALAPQEAAPDQSQPPVQAQQLPSNAAQHQHQQQSSERQQLNHGLPLSSQLQQNHKQQQRQQVLPAEAEQSLRQQRLPSQTAGLSTDASQSQSQFSPAVPSYQPQSSASTFIQATLAAINTDHSVTSAQRAAQQGQSNGRSEHESAGRSALPSQVTPAEQPPHTARQTAASGAFVAAVSAGHQSSVQRPPLPGKRAGQVFLTCPGFADGFANPALYQQPWLQGAASSGSMEPSSHSGRTAASTAQQGRQGSGSPALPLFHCHSQAHRDLLSSEDPLSASTTAATGSPQPPFSNSAAPWLGTDANSTMSLSAEAGRRPPLELSTVAGDSLNPDRGVGRTAGRAPDDALLFRMGNILSRQGRDEEVTGAQSSKWSAVNAYRQAREAAAKAAAGKHSL